jgi:hypothetical protein
MSASRVIRYSADAAQAKFVLINNTCLVVTVFASRYNEFVCFAPRHLVYKITVGPYLPNNVIVLCNVRYYKRTIESWMNAEAELRMIDGGIFLGIYLIDKEASQ